MFYGLRLLSATMTFRVDCHVKLVDVSLEEGGCDQLVDGRGERYGFPAALMSKRLATSRPGREADDKKDVYKLLSHSWSWGFGDVLGNTVWPRGAFGMHLVYSLTKFLLSQGRRTASSHR